MPPSKAERMDPRPVVFHGLWAPRGTRLARYRPLLHIKWLARGGSPRIGTLSPHTWENR